MTKQSLPAPPPDQNFVQLPYNYFQQLQQQGAALAPPSAPAPTHSSAFERAKLQLAGRPIRAEIDIDDLFRFGSTEKVLAFFKAFNQGTIAFFLNVHAEEFVQR